MLADLLPDLDSFELSALSSLKYNNGQLILQNDPEMELEVAALIRLQGYATTVNFLQDAPDRNSLYWNLPVWQTSKNKLQRELAILQEKEMGIKGVGKCSKCGSDDIAMALIQTRSGDEPMTQSNRCVQCDYRWKS